MRIVIRQTAEESGQTAAADVAALLDLSTGRALGVATGSSPQPLYGALAQRVAGGLGLGGVRAFALDEYVGILPEHPESYHAVIEREVTVPLRLEPGLVRVPDGRATDPAAAADEYDAAIVASGGIDVQILGVGTNGHIGFNEPGSSPSSRTRVVRLAASTRAANARFFATPDLVPKHAITQGIGTILDARHLVLVASGVEKAQAVRDAIEGPLAVDCPASFLQAHPDAVLYLDAAAASRLSSTAPAPRA